MFTKRMRWFVKILLPIIIIVAFAFFLQITVISNPEKITLWLSSFGPFLIFVYILIQSAAIIIPPVPGAAFQIALIALFGPLKGLILIYLTVTPLYCINFLLAKKYGRPLVEKLSGQKTLAKVDHYTKEAGLGTLIILKLLQGSYFDFFSYGLGLTKIPFRQFFWVNLLGGIPADILDYFIFKNSPNFIISIIIIQISVGILTGGYILIRHWHHKKTYK
ncbi:TVP38/TMEM64 family protein [Candidatus Gottesmanbacteria bacterium]|nr:TVP38/TMEM64 family protein [Candidatus Gottesmanbacteria bacterium]